MQRILRHAGGSASSQRVVLTNFDGLAFKVCCGGLVGVGVMCRCVCVCVCVYVCVCVCVCVCVACLLPTTHSPAPQASPHNPQAPSSHNPHPHNLAFSPSQLPSFALCVCARKIHRLPELPNLFATPVTDEGAPRFGGATHAARQPDRSPIVCCCVCDNTP